MNDGQQYSEPAFVHSEDPVACRIGVWRGVENGVKSCKREGARNLPFIDGMEIALAEKTM
jgi:hypothetical protein